jgi:hypothetical protein
MAWIGQLWEGTIIATKPPTLQVLRKVNNGRALKGTATVRSAEDRTFTVTRNPHSYSLSLSMGLGTFSHL